MSSFVSSDVRVIEVDLGWNAIMSKVHLLDGTKVKVGFPEGSQPVGYKTLPSLLEVATKNEFGAVIKNKSGSTKMPERSYLRSSFDEKIDKIMSSAKVVVKRATSPAGDVGTSLSLFGSQVVDLVKDKIEAGGSPYVANAKRTIAKKGFNRPLIESGDMKKSVQYKITKKG